MKPKQKLYKTKNVKQFHLGGLTCVKIQLYRVDLQVNLLPISYKERKLQTTFCASAISERNIEKI